MQEEVRREAAKEMARGRVLRAYGVEAKYESLRMLRSPAFAGPFLMIPAALYLLFGSLLYGAEIAKDPKSAVFIFMGFSVLGVMGPGMFGFGMTVATEREQGLLQLKRALPMPRAANLLAKMLMSILFVAIVMATMTVAAPLGHVHLSAARLLGLALINIFGTLPFCALGFFVGSLASAKSAPAFVNLVYLPMIYLSGILFPLPKSMAWFAHVSPAYHLSQLGRAAIGTAYPGTVLGHVMVLAGVTVVFTSRAARLIERRG
jgi:ABC-2 type transport system permease protein